MSNFFHNGFALFTFHLSFKTKKLIYQEIVKRQCDLELEMPGLRIARLTK